jgi:hypothetical protein
VVSAGHTELGPSEGSDCVAGDGNTVGNRLDGSTAETPVSGIGSEAGGSTAAGVADPAAGVSAIVSVALHAVRPRVLLMDEPCSALDPTSTRVIEETIADLVKEVTIVIVTHNMQQAQRVSDQCA